MCPSSQACVRALGQFLRQADRSLGICIYLLPSYRITNSKCLEHSKAKAKSLYSKPRALAKSKGAKKPHFQGLRQLAHRFKKN